MKKRGYTIVEVLLFLGLIGMFFYFITSSLEKKSMNESFIKVKVEVPMFIRQIQKYAYKNGSEYYIKFHFTKGKILFETWDGEVIDKVELPKNIVYFTNNTDKNSDFQRKTTINGNFDRGFSIFLADKNIKKIYYRISISTVNSMKYPVISVYKAKKPILINENYLDYSLWNEEL